MADKCDKGLSQKEDNESEKPAKIARFDVDSEQKGMQNVASLKHFKFLKILSNDANSKSICIQGALRPYAMRFSYPRLLANLLLDLIFSICLFGRITL